MLTVNADYLIMKAVGEGASYYILTIKVSAISNLSKLSKLSHR